MTCLIRKAIAVKAYESLGLKPEVFIGGQTVQLPEQVQYWFLKAIELHKIGNHLIIS